MSARPLLLLTFALSLVLPAVARADLAPPRVKRPLVLPKLPSYEFEHGALKLPGPIVFEAGTDKLAPSSDSVLEFIKGYLNAKTDITLARIEGHTDSDGAAVKNQQLSEGRAMTVAKWLVAHGIKCTRLIAVGFGQQKPIAPNDTPDNKAKNRRIDLVNAALRGRAIGGMPVDGGGRVAGDPCR